MELLSHQKLYILVWCRKVYYYIFNLSSIIRTVRQHGLLESPVKYKLDKRFKNAVQVLTSNKLGSASEGNIMSPGKARFPWVKLISIFRTTS
jgi:hypothetical protein